VIALTLTLVPLALAYFGGLYALGAVSKDERAALARLAARQA
jgi:hypothetical protein